jgi:hypothetical protein
MASAYSRISSAQRKLGGNVLGRRELVHRAVDLPAPGEVAHQLVGAAGVELAGLVRVKEVAFEDQVLCRHLAVRSRFIREKLRPLHAFHQAVAVRLARARPSARKEVGKLTVALLLDPLAALCHLKQPRAGRLPKLPVVPGHQLGTAAVAPACQVGRQVGQQARDQQRRHNAHGRHPPLVDALQDVVGERQQLVQLRLRHAVLGERDVGQRGEHQCLAVGHHQTAKQVGDQGADGGCDGEGHAVI